MEAIGVVVLTLIFVYDSWCVYRKLEDLERRITALEKITGICGD